MAYVQSGYGTGGYGMGRYDMGRYGTGLAMRYSGSPINTSGLESIMSDLDVWPTEKKPSKRMSSDTVIKKHYLHDAVHAYLAMGKTGLYAYLQNNTHKGKGRSFNKMVDEMAEAIDNIASDAEGRKVSYTTSYEDSSIEDYDFDDAYQDKLDAKEKEKEGKEKKRSWKKEGKDSKSSDGEKGKESKEKKSESKGKDKSKGKD